MSLYSKNGSYPSSLPFRIRLSNGKTRTDPSTFTAAEIADAGYTAVPSKPFPGQYQTVEWDGNDWVVVDYSTQQMQELITQHIKQIATNRYQKESEAITWTDNTGNTFILDNTFASQQRVVSAQAAVASGIRQEPAVWKCMKIDNGNIVLTFRPTTNSEISEWANIALTQVQTAFDVEAVAVEKVMSFAANTDYANALAVDFFVEYENVNNEGGE